MKIYFLVGVIGLAGCVPRSEIVRLNCFTKDGVVSDLNIDAKKPVFHSQGCTLFYGTDGKLRRVCNSVCGVSEE